MSAQIVVAIKTKKLLQVKIMGPVQQPDRLDSSAGPGLHLYFVNHCGLQSLTNKNLKTKHGERNQNTFTVPVK